MQALISVNELLKTFFRRRRLEDQRRENVAGDAFQTIFDVVEIGVRRLRERL